MDQALKPESIDRVAAFAATTRPEDVREQLRQQLTIESERVGAELDLLKARRAQVEAAIVKADAICASCNRSPNVGGNPEQFDRSQMASSFADEVLDVQMKASEAEARLAQLNYDLKPENIERALAGIGSSKPEELRDQRRQLLSLEKATVVAKLQLLREIKLRLEPFEYAEANVPAVT